VLLAGSIDRSIKIFKLAANGIVYNLRPGFVGLPKSDSIGVAWTPVATEGLVGKLGDVRSAHDNWDSYRANSIGDAIRFGDHSGHGANADQSDVFVSNVLSDLNLVHGLSVAVNQQNFMTRRSQ
jgi:hypothetical protein